MCFNLFDHQANSTKLLVKHYMVKHNTMEFSYIIILSSQSVTMTFFYRKFFAFLVGKKDKSMMMKSDDTATILANM